MELLAQTAIVAGSIAASTTQSTITLELPADCAL